MVQILLKLTRDDIVTFVAGAVLCAGFEVWKCDFRGNREVARCDGGDISWQAQYFVLVRRVDAERFVAGAGIVRL